MRLSFGLLLGLDDLKIQEVAKLSNGQFNPLKETSPQLRRSGSSVLIAADEAPFLCTECGTTPDDEGRINEVDSGGRASKEDLLVRRLPDHSRVYALCEEVVAS